MTNPNALSVNLLAGKQMADNDQINGLVNGAYNFNALSMQSVTAGTAGAAGLFWESAQDNITAHAGGGQASATQLYNEVNRITTVATSGDSVMLPPAQPGFTIMVINHGANPMQVYGSNVGTLTDAIDDVATATGASQMQGSVVFYTCATQGKWYSEGLATGYSGQLQTLLSADGITAINTGTWSTAQQLTAMVNRLTTVTSSGASVKLPSSAPGLVISVINDGSSLATVFGFNVGDTIDGSTSGAPLTAVRRAQFFCTTAGSWASVSGSKSA